MAARTWTLRNLSLTKLLTGNLDLSSIIRSQRRHGRAGLRRTPLRILSPEEEERKLSEIRQKKSRPTRLAETANNNDTNIFVHESHAVIDQSLQSSLTDVKPRQKETSKQKAANTPHFKFEILKEGDDSRFGPVVMCTRSRKHREKKREVLLEGTRLIKDAIKAGAVLKTMFFSKMEALEDLPMKDFNVPIYKVAHHSLKLWSDTVTSPGVMGIFQMPNQGEISMVREDTIPVTLVCDNVRDPGNLGTIIRVAAASGCERVLLSKGCVDIWEPKVLRSGAGCHFRVPIINNLDWETLVSYFPSESQACLADVRRIDASYEYKSRLSPEDLNKILAQSSNTGELSQGREDSDSESEFSSEDSPDDKSKYRDKASLTLYRRLRLPSKVYHEVDFSGKSSVLIISNESTGPSPQAKKAVFDNYGQSVIVPMATNVESLNNSVAAGIILFEIKRQLMNNK